MTNHAETLASSLKVSSKVSTLLQKRLAVAQEHFATQMQAAAESHGEALLAQPTSPWALWREWYEYAVDAAQRSVLMLDTLRQRGNNFVEHSRAGLPPLLHFDYEMVLDARKFARPVNYALVRIVPPAGVVVDEKRRPYVIIDPRAGHGPGIGGFKDDSQVGVALRDGHPVYFVIFFPEPEEGQTLPDVCAAEAQFIRKVRELHPDSAKPAIVGNCQGGWAAMMLAASNPDDTGPLVINGAPMSYWGGAWSEGEGDNPMRYSGGLLGGSWLASLVADLSNGKFDGAWLVQNFENLHPANTFWDKYYHVYANVDTEPPRFLEFERWWGGFYLLNREEIEWIVQNLFVGNKLWSGDSKVGGVFDLREVKAPIVLFASLGDNITPPQQAFNWVADIYGSTEEIKARGQVIVGLLHQDIGHLGIFVSGKVANKEHAQIVSVLKSIEALPPGLYGMQIHEANTTGRAEYEVQFVEHRLEEVMQRLNRFQRADERAFAAAAGVSEFNQRAYETFARPLVQAMSSEAMAEPMRELQPLRAQRSAISDLNPWLWWVAPAAAMVAQYRQAVEPEQRFRQAEGLMSDMISASLDYYRRVRDALSEAAFFQIYGNMLVVQPMEDVGAAAKTAGVEPRSLPYVSEALASIAKGGYAEAVARVAYLLKRKDKPLPLELLNTKQEMIEDYRSLLPDTTFSEQRRVRGRQEIIVNFEPERALETLPDLVAKPEDRERLVTLLERLLADPRVQRVEPTAEQRRILDRIRSVLGVEPAVKELPAPDEGKPRGRRKS